MTEAQFIVQVITVLVLLYLALFKSYFQEKGKNIATKEDIAEITQSVESVKHAFTKEAEILKADIQLLTNVQVGLVAEERNAIIDLNEKYFLWLNILTEIGLGNTDLNNNSEIDAYVISVANLYTDFRNSETRFSLFIENKELTKYEGELKIQTLKLMPKINVIGHKYKELNFEKEMANLKLSGQALSDALQEIRNKTTAMLDENTKDMLENFKVISPMSAKFQTMCREHLYQLLNK